MTATSISRIVVPSLALVAACGAALVVGIAHVRREPPVETRAATAAPAVSLHTSGSRDEGSAALSTAQAEANAVAAAPAVSPRSPDTDESVPILQRLPTDRHRNRTARRRHRLAAARARPGANSDYEPALREYPFGHAQVTRLRSLIFCAAPSAHFSFFAALVTIPRWRRPLAGKACRKQQVGGAL
jgi:hypothetical protein